MSLSSSRVRLEALSQDLLRNWAEVREQWRDVKGLEFERRYMQELTARIEKTVTVIDKLDELLTRVKRDCE
jgi:hypothetical protein